MANDSSTTGNEEPQEFCGLCDEFFRTLDEYLDHLESNDHMEKLVGSNFLSKKCLEVFQLLQERFRASKIASCCGKGKGSLLDFVSHLACPCQARLIQASTEHVEEEKVRNGESTTKFNNSLEFEKHANCSKLAAKTHRIARKATAPPTRSFTTKKIADKGNHAPVKKPEIDHGSSSDTDAQQQNAVANAGKKMEEALEEYMVMQACKEGKRRRVTPPMGNMAHLLGSADGRRIMRGLARHTSVSYHDLMPPAVKRTKTSNSSVANKGGVANGNSSNKRRPSSSSEDEKAALPQFNLPPDYYESEKYPAVDLTGLDVDTFFAQDADSSVLDRVENCSLNVTNTITNTERDRYGNSVCDRHCTFIIFQCSRCSALLTDNSRFTDHFYSHSESTGRPSRHKQLQEGAQTAACGSGGDGDVACLVCEGVVLKTTVEIRRHMMMSIHSTAVNKFAIDTRGTVSRQLMKLQRLKKLQTKNPSSLKELTEIVAPINALVLALIRVCQIIVAYHKDSRHLQYDITPDMFDQEKHLIPELKFYLNMAFRHYLPRSFHKFKGLFYCTLCSGLFCDLQMLVDHAVKDISHLIRSCFRLKDNSSVVCFYCQHPHLAANCMALIESCNKTNPSTGEKYECIRFERGVESRSSHAEDDEDAEEDVKTLSEYLKRSGRGMAKLDGVDAKVLFKCKSVSCSSSSKWSNMSSLSAVYRHLTSRIHTPPSSELKLNSIKIECSCCKAHTSSFVSLVAHCLTGAKLKVLLVLSVLVEKSIC